MVLYSYLGIKWWMIGMVKRRQITQPELSGDRRGGATLAEPAMPRRPAPSRRPGSGTPGVDSRFARLAPQLRSEPARAHAHEPGPFPEILPGWLDGRFQFWPRTCGRRASPGFGSPREERNDARAF